MANDNVKKFPSTKSDAPSLTPEDLRLWQDVQQNSDSFTQAAEKLELQLTAIRNGLQSLQSNLQVIFLRTCAKQKLDPDEWDIDRAGILTHKSE